MQENIIKYQIPQEKDLIYLLIILREKYNNNLYTYECGIISAPSQSLLQRWIREIYEIAPQIQLNLI